MLNSYKSGTKVILVSKRGINYVSVGDLGWLFNEIAVELNPYIELYLIELYLDRVIPDKERAFQAGGVA